MRLRQAAEIAIKAMDMDAKDADKISFERLAKIVAAGVALKEAMSQLDRKCEAGPSLQDLWDCWDAVHGGQEPVAWKGITGDYGFPFLSFHEQPGMEPLYLHPALIPEWKDHNTAQLVNELTEIAIKYRDMQQLRERIAYVIRPLADKVKSTST